MNLKYALVPAYLLHSYLYYILHISVITDEEFDEICRQLLENWDKHKHHQHAELINRDDLKAGTGFAIPKNQYPSRVTHMADRIYHDRGYWHRMLRAAS